MRELPIIFSDEMVRSLLAGTKTQTRRVIKPSWVRCLDLDDEDDRASALAQCPYGVPGDQLWVREAWRLPTDLDRLTGAEAMRVVGMAPPVQYVADGARSDRWIEWCGSELSGRYRHARFMPRWASRITLPVLSVRVERLQAITEEDARAEGVRCESSLAWDEGMAAHAITGCDPYAAAVARGHRAGFRELWDSINAARPGCSWDANPWVWAITFNPAEVRS